MDLFSRFRQKGKILFLDPQSNEPLAYSAGEKISIILSPSLYWVKKLNISVKYLRDLKKLLPSIFEDTLPEGNYSYSAYKSDDGYFAFAYEDRKIIEVLKKRGVELSDIVSIHFAQSELTHLDEPCLLNDKQVISLQDDVVILAPRAWYGELPGLDLSSLELSNHTLQLQQFNHIVDNKSLYKIGYLLLFLALILMVELYITKDKLSSVIAQKETIFKEYKLKSTMMQNRAILQKYEKIDATQRALREYISYFLKMRLQDGESLESLKYKNKILTVRISGATKRREKQLLTMFIKNKIPYTLRSQDKELIVEVKL